MEFFRNRALVDLHPFFEDFIRWHRVDYELQKKDPDFKERKKRVTYVFSLVGFYETFCGNFTPRQIGCFLEEHLEEDEMSAEFLSMLSLFETRYQVAIPWYHHRNHDKERTKVSLYPVNLATSDLDQLILANIPRHKLPKVWEPLEPGWYRGARDDIDGNDVSRFSHPIYANDGTKEGVFTQERLRISWLEKEPLTVMPWIHGGIQSLDSWSLIKAYHLPTDHLTIVRRK